MNPNDALDVAARIAHRLARDAEWSGGRCTWTVRVPDYSADTYPLPSLAVPADGSIYNGTSGIGLFLLENWRLTGDARLLEVVEGAFLRAADLVDELPRERSGFYSGRSGIAYAFARLFEITRSERWALAATRAIRPLVGHERLDQTFDVMTGAAGGVIALAEVANILDAPELLASVRELADHLVESTYHTADGWSWPGNVTYARNLLGYGHGVSGMAHALLEAFRLTGVSKYRYAAEQGFAYERGAFDPVAGNWPDYRMLEMSLASRGGIARARQWAADGRIPSEFKPTFMTAWCHGAGGIGLSRVHAYRVLGGENYREEAISAVRNVENYLESPGNYSLCHGAMGNAETLLWASTVLGDVRAASKLLTIVERGCNEFELAGRPWPSGTLNQRPDPSLMVGDAGIGYVYLRIADGSVPSLLLPTITDVPQTNSDESDAKLRAAYRQEFFPLTLNTLAERGRTEWRSAVGGMSELATLVDQLDEVVTAGGTHPEDDSLGECYALERARYELALAHRDRGNDIIAELKRPPLSSVDWGHVRVALAVGVRVVWTRCQWSFDDGGLLPPTQRASGYLLRGRDGITTIRPITVFASTVLTALETPATLVELTWRVAQSIADEQALNSTLQKNVRLQLESAYTAGLLQVTTCEAPPESNHDRDCA